MASSNFLLNAVKGPLKDTIDKARTGAPAAIDKALTAASGAVAGSVEAAVALFRRLYTDLSARVAAWIPTTKAKIATTADRLGVWAKGQVEKL